MLHVMDFIISDCKSYIYKIQQNLKFDMEVSFRKKNW